MGSLDQHFIASQKMLKISEGQSTEGASRWLGSLLQVGIRAGVWESDPLARIRCPILSQKKGGLISPPFA